MKNLYTVADYLENEPIENITISKLIKEFNQAFVKENETFSKNEVGFITRNMELSKFAKALKNEKFTSFHLVEGDRKLFISFPLFENTKSYEELIKDEDSLENFYGLINHLKQSFNVKIKEQTNTNGLFSIKRTFSSKPKIEVSFAEGKFTADGRKTELCNSEKLVKIIDTISSAYCTRIFNKLKEYYPTKVKVATQLLCDYLLLTKLQFSNELVKHKICKAVALQFSNRLNACDLSDLTIIMTSARVVSEMLESMISEEQRELNQDILNDLLKGISDESITLFDNKEDNNTVIEDQLSDIDFLEYDEQKDLNQNEVRLLLEGDYMNIKNNVPVVAKKNSVFRQKSYLNAFDKMLVRVIKKKVDSIDKKIAKNKNCEQNRRTRQYLAYFCLKYNLLINNNKSNIKVDNYYFNGLDLSDETKAQNLAVKIFETRNNIVEFIKTNFNLFNEKTPKQKMDYCASFYGCKNLTQVVNNLIDSSVKSLFEQSKNVNNNQNVNEM